MKHAAQDRQAQPLAGAAQRKDSRAPEPLPEASLGQTAPGGAQAAQRKPADLMNDSPRMAAQRKYAEGIHNSPYVTAQRQKFERLFGSAAQLQKANALPSTGAVAPQLELHPAKPDAGLPVNDDAGLEHEADVMGARARAHKDGDVGGRPEETDRGMGVPHARGGNELAIIQNVRPDSPVQAVWLEHEGKIYKWDQVINGRQWYYDTATKKYYFEVLDMDVFFGAMVEGDWRDYLSLGGKVEFSKEAIQQKLKKVKPSAHFGAYFTKEDSALEKFPVPDVPITDQATVACLNLLNPNTKKSAFVEMLLGEKKVQPSFLKTIMDSLPQLLQKKGITIGILEKVLTIGDDYCVLKEEGYFEAEVAKGKMQPLVQNKIVPMINEAIWFHILPQIQKESEESSEGGGLLGEWQEKIANFEIKFTNRVPKEKYEVGMEAVILLHKKLTALSDPDHLLELMTGGMQEDFFSTLEQKDISIGNKEGNKNKEISEEIFLGISEQKEKLSAYAKSVCIRWGHFLKKKLVVVFDSAGLKTVFGKTPAIKGATPENMMQQEDTGLESNALAVINLDSHETSEAVFITLAHECAHMVGFNPTDHEESGHFTDSNEYKEKEKEFGPKLLFDAYYFEILMGKQ